MTSYAVKLDEQDIDLLVECGKAMECPAAEIVIKEAIRALAEKINKRRAIAANENFVEIAENWLLHPSDFDGSNAVFGPPEGAREGEVHSLCAANIRWGDYRAVLSCWKPTQEQLDRISATGRLWLVVMGTGMPPVALASEKPTEKQGIETA